MQVDDHFRDAVVSQEPQVVRDQRMAADLDEGLRPVEGERPQAGAEPGGEDHCPHAMVASAVGQESAANSAARPPGSGTSARKRRTVAITSGRNTSGAGFPFASAT